MTPLVSPNVRLASTGSESHGRTTHLSLLSGLRDPANAAAWREFERRYRELLVRFCRRRGLQQADAEDVVQVVFVSLSRRLPSFIYDRRRGRFRDYLLRCTRNAIVRWSTRPKTADFALDPDGDAPLEDPSGVEAQIWEQEWVAHHYRLAMENVRTTFDPRSAEIFDRSVAGATVASLAAEFNLSEQAVHKVRQRIRNRLEELIAAQLLEEEAVDG